MSEGGNEGRFKVEENEGGRLVRSRLSKTGERGGKRR